MTFSFLYFVSFFLSIGNKGSKIITFASFLTIFIFNLSKHYLLIELYVIFYNVLQDKEFQSKEAYRIYERLKIANCVPLDVFGKVCVCRSTLRQGCASYSFFFQLLPPTHTHTHTPTRTLTLTHTHTPTLTHTHLNSLFRRVYACNVCTCVSFPPSSSPCPYIPLSPISPLNMQTFSSLFVVSTSTLFSLFPILNPSIIPSLLDYLYSNYLLLLTVNRKVMTVCANRSDGARALNLARDQRTACCGPPQEKFMVRYTPFCAVQYSTVIVWGWMVWEIVVCAMLCYALLYSTVQCRKALYCTVLYYTTLYCTVLYCTVPYCTVLYLQKCFKQ